MTSEEFEDRMWLIDMMQKYRQELWVSQAELAEYTGLTQSIISRIETGRGNPTYLTLMRLARVVDKRIGFV